MYLPTYLPTYVPTVVRCRGLPVERYKEQSPTKLLRPDQEQERKHTAHVCIQPSCDGDNPLYINSLGTILNYQHTEHDPHPKTKNQSDPKHQAKHTYKNLTSERT